MALSVQERERVRYHLGFLNTQPAGSISLGLPSATQTLFVLNSSMDTILPEAEASVRRAIKELDCIEDQLSQIRSQLAIKRADNVQFDTEFAVMELESQYQLWAKTLADIFGVPINPFSLKHQRFSGEVFVVEPY